MPKHKRFDPLAKEKKAAAKQIADLLELITPKERQKIAVELECSERTVQNYGGRVVDLTLASSMLTKLKAVTQGRKAIA